MPKERITSDSYFDVNANGASLPPDSGAAVKTIRFPQMSIHWGKNVGDYVQIGFDVDVEDARRQLNTPEEMIRVYTDRLSREQINHAIRALRRARDHTFGRDE